ncbi:MAG: response regulator [Verrucomicrobia bacterium]|nr:response regulator [Verrucomicrobiota bacterium]
MKKEIRILMVEDDIADAEMTKYALREGGFAFSLQRVDSKVDFLRELNDNSPDLILSDSALPSFDGYSALALAREKCPEIPFIFVTGTMGEEVAIETLKSGATDYVIKTRLSRLVPAVHRALRESEERAERRRAEEKLRESHEQLRALSVYLQHVREEERTRIAREVHDELGQTLTGLKIDLAWIVGRLPKDEKTLQDKARTMFGHIDTTIQTVRRISTELRPGILDDLGLVAAIEWQANEFQTRTGIQCHVFATNKAPILDEDLNTAFFRIFQETLTNIIRHANATRADVRLTEESGKLVLEVKDNGRGISEADIAQTKSIGLLGMRERAALVGGEFNIRGTTGKGTTVTVRIPLRRSGSMGQRNHENSYRRRSRGSAPRPEANSRG